MSVALPSELVDRIIDHLQTDKPSLFACSLVCKLWQVRSRYHLFRRVRADPVPPDEDNGPWQMVPPFPEDILHLFFYTEELYLSHYHDGFSSQWLDATLRHMPRLQSLTLDISYWRMDDTSISFVYPSIHTLSLLHVKLGYDQDDEHVSRKLFHIFPSLRHLSILGYPPFDDLHPDIPSSFPNSLSLESYSGDDGSSEISIFFLQRLRLTSSLDSLVHLDMGTVEDPDLVYALKTLDPRIKKNLRSFRAGVNDAQLTEGWSALSLHDFTSLTSVTVLMPGWHILVPHYRAFLSFSTSVKNVIFQFTTPPWHWSGDAADANVWEELENMALQMKSLRCLEFTINYDARIHLSSLPITAVEAQLRRHLPVLDERHLLRICGSSHFPYFPQTSRWLAS
ncbi:unnamed protein product [Somion occarium]|uniref:F-box domain-containing protein n=1 Tax=Somion occarium TaxID=3059160 RepID=A0ABP1E8L6_9APHY